MTIPSEKRRSCADAALLCHGTAYIFEKRAGKIRMKIAILSFLGIAGPASVGAIVATFKLSLQNVEYVLLIAGIIAAIQLLLSIWSLVSKWNDSFSYYLESKATNYRLSKRYDDLCKTTTLSEHDFDVQFGELEKEAELRATLDNQYDVKDAEKRMGMRYGLRKYQRECAGCGKVPKSMKATDCDICGNY
jgi:mobilome CxxCx(11)CxxC protein